jgi:hypothetical protein
MSVVTTSNRPPTLTQTTFDQLQPGQAFWTGEQWNTVLDITDGADPGTVTVHRLTAGDLVCATDYRTGRKTSVRLLAT